jgi:hypothetical protein
LKQRMKTQNSKNSESDETSGDYLTKEKEFIIEIDWDTGQIRAIVEGIIDRDVCRGKIMELLKDIIDDDAMGQPLEIVFDGDDDSPNAKHGQTNVQKRKTSRKQTN